MKKISLYILLGAAMLWSCASPQAQEHDHAHEGTSHEEHPEHEHEEGHLHEEGDHQGHEHAHEGTSHEEHPVHEHEEGHQHEEGEEVIEHSDEIIFTPAQAAQVDFEVTEVIPADFSQVIPASGKILALPGDETSLSAPVDGIVLFRKSLTDGMEVGKGQALLSISTEHMAEGDYTARAKAQYEFAKAAYERAKVLVKDNIISQKEYESAELDYRNAKTAYHAVASGSGTGGILVSSPMNGFLKNIQVSQGQYVQKGQILASVSQNRKLQLRAEVSEKYYQDLPRIRSAHFKTPYSEKTYALEQMNGRMLSFGRSSDNASFYTPVTFEFDNSGDIIPGAYAEIFLLAAPLPNTISVPVTALIEEMGNYYVFVRIDEEGYRKREIKLGANDGIRVQVVSGLEPGEQVVTRGAYQVKLASISGAIPEGHSHAH